MTRRLSILALALLLAGCASTNLEITSPRGEVKVRTRAQGCLTPCTLRVPVGRRILVRAYDPDGLIDFTYEVYPRSGLNELEVLAPAR